MAFTTTARGTATASTSPTVTTGVLTWTAGRRYFLGLSVQTVLTPLAAPTAVTGCGLTWTLVRAAVGTLVAAWVYTATGTPTAGAVTATWAGAYPALHVAAWEVGGALGVVQSAAATGLGLLTLTVPLAPSAQATDATFGWYAVAVLGALPTAGAGFTTIQTVGGGLLLSSLSEWRPSADPTATASWIGVGNAAAIAYALALAPVPLVGAGWRYRDRYDT